jgi:hypothetical protein
MARATRDPLIERLNHDAARIAQRFGLAYASIEAERAGVKRRYGVCFADGRIRIRLRHATTGNPLKYSSLVSTLCHELAHLKHFNHGERFKAFYARILEWARREGIYRPGPEPRPALPAPGAVRLTVPAGAIAQPAPRRRPKPAAPEQLSLFA